ncbi:MAG: alpha-L-rhamnosidase [Verrucomicrobia bacterium]|nr:alpha-L-rhamnosidase [Verrucomicrobiota bacterium]
MPIPPPPPLVYTPFKPRAVARSSGAKNPESCLLRGETLLAPSSAPASLVLDFGEELVGVLTLDAAADASTKLELIYGEDLEEALLLQDPFAPDHWYHQPRDFLELVPGAQRVRHPGRRAFRFVNVIVHGPGALRLHGAEMMLEHAGVKDRGSFACSDPLLNDAWEISRRTLRLCLQGFYEDGVKRDGMLWIGDYRVEFLCAHYLFGEAALARRSLEMFAHCRHDDGSLSAVALLADGHMYPRIKYLGDLSTPGGLHRWVLANYCADFVSAVWEYVLHTGDRAAAGSLAPTVRGVLEFLGKVDVEHTKIAETFITDNQVDHGNWWGSRSALAYQIAAAFNDGAKIAELLGDAILAERCRAEHRQRLPAAAKLFGDPARGACRDDAGLAADRASLVTSAATRTRRGSQRRETGLDSTRSWHAHAAAFLAGAVTPAELRAAHVQLEKDPGVRRPMAGFMEFYLLQAWFDAGLVREALDEMRSYYGQMLRSGATTTWELVDRRVPGIDHLVAAGRSHCHGWSAGPAWILPAKILGVMPAAPGFRRVSIRPALGDLAWARGKIPTPHGEIEVAVTAPSAVEIILPPGVSGTLYLEGRPPVELVEGAIHRRH